VLIRTNLFSLFAVYAVYGRYFGRLTGCHEK